MTARPLFSCFRRTTCWDISVSNAPMWNGLLRRGRSFKMTVQPIKPLAFTIHDAVAYSGLSRSRLYTLIQSNELPSLQVGGRRMILRGDLDAFFARLAKAA